MPRPIPGKINMASAGSGAAHMSGELFKMMAGVDMVHVPYRGAAAGDHRSASAGQVQVLFDPLPSSIEYIRAGKLRALAVTTATRSEALPDVPTVGDFVPGYEASAWVRASARPRTRPPRSSTRLNKEINAALADPKLKGAACRPRRHAVLGARRPTSACSSSPRRTEKWGKVVEAAGIKAE